ncbi:MAG: hypothetical protein QM737_18235 [Ferruginibacter sp.]
MHKISLLQRIRNWFSPVPKEKQYNQPFENAGFYTNNNTLTQDTYIPPIDETNFSNDEHHHIDLSDPSSFIDNNSTGSSDFSFDSSDSSSTD